MIFFTHGGTGEQSNRWIKKERMYVWIEGWIGPNVIIDNIYNDMTDRLTDTCLQC